MKLCLLCSDYHIGISLMMISVDCICIISVLHGRMPDSKEAVKRKIISTLIIALWICGKLLKMLHSRGFQETNLCEKLSSVIHNAYG
ncbi:MAG TPA: hypothetical protein DEV97_03305 [Lachnospiraceae bacterium]|nr:hypothetical protein [Lachnospiraceae bacterium]